VPASTVPGERVSPTQPFPTKPPAFEPQGLAIDDLIDFTPELRAEAEAIVSEFEYGPLYTPPSLRGTIQVPGWGGGANWYGAAFDPETGYLYVPSRTGPIVVQLQEPDPERSDFRYRRGRGGSAAGPQGLPLLKPPGDRVRSQHGGTRLDGPARQRDSPAVDRPRYPRSRPGRWGRFHRSAADAESAVPRAQWPSPGRGAARSTGLRQGNGRSRARDDAPRETDWDADDLHG